MEYSFLHKHFWFFTISLCCYHKAINFKIRQMSFSSAIVILTFIIVIIVIINCHCHWPLTFWQLSKLHDEIFYKLGVANYFCNGVVCAPQSDMTPCQIYPTIEHHDMLLRTGFMLACWMLHIAICVALRIYRIDSAATVFCMVENRLLMHGWCFVHGWK